MKNFLEEARLKYIPPLPPCLRDITSLKRVAGEATQSYEDNEIISDLFSKTYGQPVISYRAGGSSRVCKPLRVGIVLSGGQAAGGHNVIAGLLDALFKIERGSKLFGFLGGPSGIVDCKTEEISLDQAAKYMNSGGFDWIGSGRTKIETPEQLAAAKKSVEKLSLDGLVVVGGDDSNTNAAMIAEYFSANNCSTKVVGVPKTIDGDLRGEFLQLSFGFDTACKTYSEMIGNIARDAVSAKKYYHFIKLMGRSASHITLECALQTCPNLAIIGEEVAYKKMTLNDIVKDMADVICSRSKLGKEYGVFLVPEGLIEFVPEIHQLISELNQLILNKQGVKDLSDKSKKTWDFLPSDISEQLLLDRDPHGNIQVSHIATEQLLLYAVENELQSRSDYKGKFYPIHHFFGYEGRSGFPSNFDANYCYALGHIAAVLINDGLTGYMTVVNNINKSVDKWEIGGIPITMLMHLENRKGKVKAVVQKNLVDLEGKLFGLFAKSRDQWRDGDFYRYPGPIQFFGPPEVCDSITYTLSV